MKALHALLKTIIAAGFLCAGAASATPTVGIAEDWDTLGDGGGWTNSAPTGTGQAGLGNSASNLAIRFPTNFMPVQNLDSVYAPQTSVYTGDYSKVGLSFQWYATDAPAYAGIFFRSGATIWEHEFDSSILNTWVGQSIAFSWSAGWSGGADEAAFLSDLANVDLIGISVTTDVGTDDSEYWLDDWEYTVPEPGSLLMIGVVFLSCGAAFRRRLRGLFVVHS